MTGESEAQRQARRRLADAEVAAERLDGAKREMLDEYESRGRLDLRHFVRVYPDLAGELTEYALWVRSTPPVVSITPGTWRDDGGVAMAALDAACEAVSPKVPRRTAMAAKSSRRWSNKSVQELAGDQDPIEVITNLARQWVIEAMDAGWEGPPFDPIRLAEIRKLKVVGRDDVRDARIVATSDQSFVIEFNPNRPPARVRYSLAHEIAHTLFPDCGEQIRNRAARHEISGDDWQLEALCNIAASEFLMPIGTLPHLRSDELAIERLIEMKQEYQVSAEALLIRVARLADEPCLAFCASRIDNGKHAGRYRIDYTIPSETWAGSLPRATLLPPDTRVGECTAIGFTAKSIEGWPGDIGRAYVECVGVAPYPGGEFPRVVGMLRALDAIPRERCVTYVSGDATQPRGVGAKIIAHVVNDATPNWGSGFPLSLRKRWGHIQEEFVGWVSEDRGRLKLGNVHEVELDGSCSVIHMVAQRGYGPSPTPRIRYAALRACLEQVAWKAKARNASLHMPRIGAGQAGGSWPLIEEIIRSTLCSAGVNVTIYDLPGRTVLEPPQIALEL